MVCLMILDNCVKNMILCVTWTRLTNNLKCSIGCFNSQTLVIYLFNKTGNFLHSQHQQKCHLLQHHPNQLKIHHCQLLFHKMNIVLLNKISLKLVCLLSNNQQQQTHLNFIYKNQLVKLIFHKLIILT